MWLASLLSTAFPSAAGERRFLDADDDAPGCVDTLEATAALSAPSGRGERARFLGAVVELGAITVPEDPEDVDICLGTPAPDEAEAVEPWAATGGVGSWARRRPIKAAYSMSWSGHTLSTRSARNCRAWRFKEIAGGGSSLKAA